MLVLTWFTVSFAQFILDVQHMNFGNYYYALTNSLWAIRHCKSSCIVTQSQPNVVFQPAFNASNRAGIIVTTDLRPIVGSFYYSHISKYILSSAPTLLDRINVMCPFVELVRVNLPALDMSLESFTDDDTLVAHIRSGDIFAGSVHPKYWQPPLGYYQFIARSYRKIVICAQDIGNPVVMALYDYCTQSRGNASCLLRVGQPLKSDVAFLTRVKNLAIGCGTFGIAVCALSNSVKRLFHPASTLLQEIIKVDFGSQNVPKRCASSSIPTVIAIEYNTTQITMGEPWKKASHQLVSLLIDQSRLEGLREIRNNER